MTQQRSPYTLRPGKYIEYDFPLREVNRLAQKEAYSKKPIYTMHKWWARRLSCVFRTVLLASAIDWTDWDALEPWKRDADGDYLDMEGAKIVHERDYHRRVRDTRASAEWHKKTGGLLGRAPTAWERLYYRLDQEAEQILDKAFRGKSVLDPFMGGGTTVVETLRLGADVIGVDLNPVAWFVVKKETDGIDPQVLEEAFRQVETAVADEIRSYYKTRCPACGETADVMYVFWVKLARCLERTCGAEVPLYNSFTLAQKSGKREVPASTEGAPGMRLADGKAKGTHFLNCPNCGEVYASFERLAEGSNCPACGHHTQAALLRAGYAGRGKFTCPTCGTSHALLDAAKEQGRLHHRMYGLELYCPHCEFKGYKKPDEDDVALYNRAQHRFEAEHSGLGLPEQEIPTIGAKTKVDCDMEGHGFRYWTEMFNERQLLLLARLRDAILTLNNSNAREYLLLAWSEAIEYYSMFVSYQAGSGKTRGTFSTHAFVPKLTSTEGNLWGARFGRNTFSNEHDLIQNALAWGQAPDDNLFQTETDYTKVSIDERLFPAQGTRMLLCRSSEVSTLGDRCASLVITDPPYYGNVMYAELADFFYVWLRTALDRDYPDVFSRPLISKDEEVVETVTRGHSATFLTKDEAFFTAGLTRIFEEAARHLEDDGLMAFTFHHQANEAWASVLRTVLDAGFTINAVYPVHAEMLSSLHIYDKANISYDALIVCRKQVREPEAVNWRDVADRVYLRAERLVKELEGQARGLLPEDIYVIAIGKCLEQYSRHYYRGRSYVYWQDQPVGVAEALDGSEERGIRGIGEIVDQLVEEAEGRMWPAGLDPVSRFYAINFLGQSEVPYDRLKRRLMHNPHVTLDELERQQLVRQSGSKVKVVSEAQRVDHLLERLGGLELDAAQLNLPGMDTAPADDLTAVDRLHLLYALDQRGVLTGGLIARWAQDHTFAELARRVAESLDPKDRSQTVYQRIADALSGRGGVRLL